MRTLTSQMIVEDSRRLTGPNLFTHEPGAILEIAASPDQQAAIAAAWRDELRSLLAELGWQTSQCFDRSHATGISLMVTAPIDCLYAATEVNEAAFALATARLGTGDATAKTEILQRLRTEIAAERNPALQELAAAAADKNVAFLVDDDEVSLGFGEQAKVWPADAVPLPSEVDWGGFDSNGRVPVALITGTNGKSTTVRLAASVIAASGRVAGVTSTDYIRVGNETIDTGDYSGPGGARQLLRHPSTEVALLEVARGGMLRRGLGVTTADVALITNVAADHLGEYGIHTVDELRSAKFVVERGLAIDKPLILNADDAGVVEYAQNYPDRHVLWFGESAETPTMQAAIAHGREVVAVVAGEISRVRKDLVIPIVDVAAVPVTLGGNARHNVQNALAAAALCVCLGFDDAAIAQGLCAFSGGPEENPGRGNVFRGKGVTAVVDFAHNEHGLSAMAKTVASMPAERRLVLMGQAGDRSNELIKGLTAAALLAKPDQLVICQLPGYERGRPPEEVPRLIESLALAAGIAQEQILHASSPVDGTRAALDWAREGDLLLILALTQRGPCIQMIQRELG